MKVGMKSGIKTGLKVTRRTNQYNPNLPIAAFGGDPQAGHTQPDFSNQVAPTRLFQPDLYSQISLTRFL
jgi:hypothetical protein